MSTIEELKPEIETLQALHREMLPGSWLYILRDVADEGGVEGPRRGEIRNFKTLARLGYLERQGAFWFTSVKAARALDIWDRYLTLNRYVSEQLR